MWQIFTESLEGKVDYRDSCISELQKAVADLVTVNNVNLDGVAKF